MTALIAPTTRRPRTLPQIVENGPRTADVLRFHRPKPVPVPESGSRPRTSGNAALAAQPAQQPVRRLHAVPTPQEAEEVRKLAAAITRATMEVLAGTRPFAQLAPWLHRDLHGPVQLRADLSRSARRSGTARAATPVRGAGPASEGAAAPRLALVHRAAVVKSAHASAVEPGVYEAAVVVADAARCRAVALRIEATGRGSWLVTALEIG